MRHRRRYILAPAARAKVVALAEDAAAVMAGHGEHRDDIEELVTAAIEEAVGLVAVAIGAGDGMAELLADGAVALAQRIAEAARPSPDRLLRRAMDAAQAGDPRRSARLHARALRVLARQADE